jgi:hypothetical protein
VKLKLIWVELQHKGLYRDCYLISGPGHLVKQHNNYLNASDIIAASVMAKVPAGAKYLVFHASYNLQRYGAVCVPQIARGVEGIAGKTKVARRYSTELFRQVIPSAILHFTAWTLNIWKIIPNI